MNEQLDEQLDELERHVDELERLEGAGAPSAPAQEHWRLEPGFYATPARPTVMVIRRGGVEDLDAILRMAVRFISETQYRSLTSVNVPRLEELARLTLEQGAVFLAVPGGTGEPIGMLGVNLIAHLMSGELTASESAWWVDPEYRGGLTAVRLLARAEAWALEAGAVWMQMIAPRGEDRLREFYLRRGYVEVETLFQLRLSLHVRFERGTA